MTDEQDTARTLELVERDLGVSLSPEADGLQVICASRVKLKPVEWLLKDRIALRALSLLAGEGGKGKSAIAAEWAARATTGRLSGRFHGQPINVLWVGNEDGREDVIGPRLKMAGADLNRVFFLTTASDSLADEVNVVADIDKISARCDRHEAKLLLVDPLVEYLPGSTDSHNDMSVRQALRPMRSMAAELNISALGLVHLNKASSFDVATRIAASAGFRNASRSVLIVADHPEEEGWRVLFQNKTNWGPEERKGRAYKVEGVVVTDDGGIPILDYEDHPFTTARIVWGDEIDLDPSSLPDTRGEREAPKRNSAEEMLRVLLKDKPWPKAMLEEQAKFEGIGWRTVETASVEMGIVKHQPRTPGVRGAGPSWWALPGTNLEEWKLTIEESGVWSATFCPTQDCRPNPDPTSPGQKANHTSEKVRSAIKTEAEKHVADLSENGARPSEAKANWTLDDIARTCFVCGKITHDIDPQGRPRHKRECRSCQEQLVADWNRTPEESASSGRPGVRARAAQHPARFSDAILDAIRTLLPRDPGGVLDPFCGTGRIHELGYDSWGVEIRPAWAAMHSRTVNADATRLPFRDGTFDSVATSPVYPTGMTDRFMARDNSDRVTYMHRYGALVGQRNPSSHPNDAGTSNARRSDSRYWEIHERAWREVTRVLKPNGVFVLNVKNHIQRGAEVLVVEHHTRLLESLGYTLEAKTFLETKGHQGAGANREQRTAGEWVMRLRAPSKPER